MSQRMARRTSKLVQNADSFVTSACQSLPELAALVWVEVANIKHHSEKFERNVALKSACSNGLSFCKVQNAKLENTKETWQGNLPARVGGSSLSFWTCSGKLQPHNPSCCIPLKVSIGNFQVSTEIYSISRWSYGYCNDFVWYNSTERSIVRKVAHGVGCTQYRIKMKKDEERPPSPAIDANWTTNIGQCNAVTSRSIEKPNQNRPS